jgi:hypothetical protein
VNRRGAGHRRRRARGQAVGAEHVQRADRQHGRGGAGEPLRLRAALGRGAGEQRQVEGVARDAAPQPVRRPTRGQDAHARADLAHAHRAQRLQVRGLFGNPDQARDLARRGELGDAEADADDPQRAGERVGAGAGVGLLVAPGHSDLRPRRLLQRHFRALAVVRVE